MPEKSPNEPRHGLAISLPQLIASVLASVSAAVIASFFGVTGTLIGTAVGSLVATLGSAIYLHSITRTASYIHRPRPARPVTEAAPPGASELSHESAGATITGRPTGAEAAPERSGRTEAPRPGPGSRQPAGSRTEDGAVRRTLARFPLGQRFGWKGGLVAAVVVFVVAIGVVTAIEKVASATLAHMVGGTRSPAGSTTVGRVFSSGSSSEREPTTTTSTTTTTTEAPSATEPQETTEPPATTTTTEPQETTTTTTGVGAGSATSTTDPGTATTASGP
jgi:hypothetical protein